MNANQLLDAFGEIKDNYVLSAVNTRRPAAKVHRRPRRLALIAAIAALMLLLVGCAAAVVLHLQDMKAGEEDMTRTRNDHGRKIDPTEVTVELYTPHALKDSPIQKAIMEWRDFLGQYDPEHPQVKEEDIPQKFKLSIPTNFTYTYNCTTPEMAMKLEEITAKYDLKPLDVELLAQRWRWM